MRPLMRLLTVLTVVAASLLSPVVTSTPDQQAEAADLRLFDPGNIISDAVFFDGFAMDAGAIQAFLTSKGASCSGGSDGTPCLKNYSMETFDRAGDNLCGGYQGARSESAAVVIAKVAASCQVSPRVLLVLLEKEMGLVRTTAPTAKKLDRAAGYACPDSGNGWCDPAYAGLQNQLYRSAWQYQRYAANATSYSFRAGRNNVIQWHPNARCGTSVVYVENQATAGLYNYTPYRPNQAALNAGYGTGDGCSAYGNRNFWNYFTDWFGSTQSTGGGAILTKYQSLGGAGSALGAPIAGFQCGLRDGGCFQPFQGGSIYWSATSGAQSVTGVLMMSYADRRWETSSLGYPTGDGLCGLRDGGCFQPFQGGTLYWTPATGIAVTRDAIHRAWGERGWENGSHGYPVGEQVCGLRGGGCGQGFQNGTIYWSPGTGAYPSSGRMLDKWAALGRESGALGYPTNNEYCGLAQGGCQQNYESASLYWSPATDTHFIRGAVFAVWQASGWEGGWLGYPTTDEICGLRGGGCFQEYQNGSIYWSPATGAHAVAPDLRQRWAALGWEAGLLGYPTHPMYCGLAQGGCQQNYQNASLYWSPATDTHFIRGAIFAAWQASGWEGGWLGYPTTDEICGLRGGGCFQEYQNGSIYWSPATGAQPVPRQIRDVWAGQGWETGHWGYPVGPPTAAAAGLDQRFQRGTAGWNQNTGQVTFG